MKLYSLRNLSLTLFLKFRKYQPRYSFLKMYSHKKNVNFLTKMGMRVNEKRRHCASLSAVGHTKKAHNCGKQLTTSLIRETKVSNVQLQQSSFD